MTLSDQESRCVALACRHLEEIVGGTWAPVPGPTLDQQYPNERSPEVIVRSGSATAAVEVKRLTGDGEWNNYWTYLRSLRQSLVPACGGHWELVPAIDFRLPMDPKTRRLIKRQIEVLSTEMQPGDENVVRIPRHAPVSMSQATGPGEIWCHHARSNVELFAVAAERLSGHFMLIDDGQGQHSFISDAGRAAFVDALVDACELARRDGHATASWEEEWQLTRGEDGEGRVHLVVALFGDVWSANVEAVDLVLGHALNKFQARRWADYHVVVLDVERGVLDSAYVVEGVRKYDDAALGVVDLVLITDGAERLGVWRGASLK